MWRKIEKININHQLGLTLAELLIVLAILSLLALVSSIPLRTFFAQNQANGVLDQLFITLNAFKVKAYSEHLPVVICPSMDQKTCSDGAWNGHLLSFVDHNKNKIYDQDDELLVNHFKLPNQFTLNWRGFPKGNYLEFKPIGILSNSNGTFLLCHKDNIPLSTRKLTVSRAGLIRYDNNALRSPEFNCG